MTEQASAPVRFSPSTWRLWSLPRHVVVYLAVVELAAVIVLAATLRLVPITPRALVWFGMLVAGMLVHLEASRRIERLREIAAERKPHTHPQDVWFFAALLLLPPPLVAAVVAISYCYSWLRVYQGRPPAHRKIFSAATVILACWAAGLVLSTARPVNGPLITGLDGPKGLGLLVTAALLYFVCNYGLVVVVVILTNPQEPGRGALGNLTDVLIISGAVGLGTALALVMTTRPWLMPILVCTALALHVGLLLPQFQTASRTDAKTGLATGVAWHEQAEHELTRAHATGDGLGVLMIDLDHFKRVNDRYGHLAGDQVLRAVAASLQRDLRSYDLVGRFGGEEFVVLIPGATVDSVYSTAERVRLSVSLLRVTASTLTDGEITIPNVTASVGAAVYPATATDLTGLLQAADAAVYAAKNTGRNKTCLAPAAISAVTEDNPRP
ncbi:MAG TPA: diguanylate cyclase [Pseudonocardiaceae bacterium]|jgi:diguanylate cyclase (GGDEF)-like protein|nr:diguanylate cyclase [Pseudonocardiaceae bacterium]